jgi:hypothetical protein
MYSSVKSSVKTTNSAKKPELIKHPKIGKYDLSAENIKILQSHSKSLHPGNYQNLTIFWPLYLELHTSNVHVFNFVLNYTKKTRYVDEYFYFYEHLSPGVQQFAKLNLGKKLSGKRYLYIILVIRKGDSISAHANGLLYDTKTQILERYEPHGSYSQPSYAFMNRGSLKLMKDYISTKLGITIKMFKQPKSTCPKVGFQCREKYPRYTNFVFNQEWKIGGYCAAWSMYFIILRANNENISSKILQEKSFQNYEDLSDYIHGFYYDFLRFKSDFLKTAKKRNINI